LKLDQISTFKLPDIDRDISSMSTQNYANHAHRPLPTAIGLACWIVAVVGFWAMGRGYPWGPAMAWAGVLICLLVLLSIGRVYTTKLQDRIILLEERLRANALLGPDQQRRFPQLSAKQVAALRFASDAEFPALFEQAVSGNMTPDAIKRAVRDWRPDPHRT
jgi:hypothetical protein